ncbi:hypothetical protein ACIBEF_25160 [Micromonospora sp. NPDC050795]
MLPRVLEARRLVGRRRFVSELTHHRDKTGPVVQQGLADGAE